MLFVYGQPVTGKINYDKKKSVLGDHAPKSLMNVKYSYRKKQKLTNAPRNWDSVLGDWKDVLITSRSCYYVL